MFKREPSVERCIEFVVKYCAEVYKSEAQGNKVVDALLKSLLSVAGAKNKAVRFRACQVCARRKYKCKSFQSYGLRILLMSHTMHAQIVSNILAGLSADAEIYGDTVEQLQQCMMTRANDKIPLVRQFAIKSLTRLQVSLFDRKAQFFHHALNHKWHKL